MTIAEALEILQAEQYTPIKQWPEADNWAGDPEQANA